MSDPVSTTVKTPCETSMPTLTATISTEVSLVLPPHFSTKLEYHGWLTRRLYTLRTQLDVLRLSLLSHQEAVKAAKWRERRKLEHMK